MAEEIIREGGDEPIDALLGAPYDITVSQPVKRGVPFDVAWTGVAGATWYNIYYQGYGTDERVHLGSSNTTLTSVTIPNSSTHISVRIGVTAHNEVGSSATGWSIFVGVQGVPPTTPPSITVPPSVVAGVNFTVSWGASTNAAGGTITYDLERQAAGGSWVSVLSTGALSITTSIPTAGTYYHRVRAKNAQGQYSDWKTSSATTVTQANRPPTTPPSITIPSTIYWNTPFTISWGASTDPDGDSVVYYLERSTNGGAWAQILSGTTQRTHNDSLGITVSYVAYRVRARDTSNSYSEWRTSETRNVTNRVPTTPASITLPATVRAGTPFTIEWGASTDPDGHSVSYTLDRSINSAAFANVITGATTRTRSDTIHGVTSTSVQYRVRGVDAIGGSGAWKLSSISTVTHDKPPTISGYDRHIGTMAQGFTYDYTATDPAGHDLAVVEYINGAPIRDITVKSGAQQTFSVLGNTFSLLPNGTNTLKISAASVTGQIATRTITFTKEPDRISTTYTEPEKCRIRPTRINIFPRGNFPAGAIYKAYATNNGLDEAPIWEDCTQAVNSRVAHVFQNKRKRSSYWGVNFKLEIFRGCSIEKDACTLNGISIQWE